jgi:hypothetical protein
VAFLATWHTYIVLHETYWRCMDIVYASRKMPSMEGKFDFFSRQIQGPHILLEGRVRSLSLSGSLSKFVHDRACKEVGR